MSFLGIDIKTINKDYKNTIISLDKVYKFDEYLSTLYYCYNNGFNVLIGDIDPKLLEKKRTKDFIIR